jgi:UDP-MurNAc hydroxylase
VKVTFLGHAGLYIETAGGSILCDPWFNPAYFASWFPFPSNEELDLTAIATPDYLYISHLHRDHFDPLFLAQWVSRAATVLVPEFPLDELKTELSRLGFSRFETLPHGVTVDLDGLRVMAAIASGPSDGPFGDSALAVDDGSARLLDQNDARPRDLDALAAFGRFDAHFLQFSGAIWYPLVYDMAPAVMAEAGRQKRLRGMDRAALFAEQVDARHLFPCAGPPCFLDTTLFQFNDVGDDGSNPFPDQTVFLDYLQQRGRTNAHLVVPGTVVTLEADACNVVQPTDDEDQLRVPFRDKAAYLHSYQARKQPVIEATHASWPEPGDIDVVAVLKGWWEPLLADAGWLCDAIGAPVLLEAGEVGVVIDFPARQVRAHAGEHCPYAYRVEPGVVEASIRDHATDWVNGLFLSMRFRASRDGGYNEHIYTFFKCLSPERLHYAERWSAAAEAPAEAPGEPRTVVRGHARDRGADEWCQIDGWRVQGRCPHLQGDLERFGSIEDDVLTCKLHGYRFDLATRQCLTTGEPDAIRAERLPAGDA